MDRVVYVLAVPSGKRLYIGTEEEFVRKIATDLVCGTKYSCCVDTGIRTPESWNSLAMRNANLSGKDFFRVYRTEDSYYWDEEAQDYRCRSMDWIEDITKSNMFIYDDGTAFNPKKYFQEVRDKYHAIQSGAVQPYGSVPRYWFWKRRKNYQGRRRHRYSTEGSHSSLKYYRMLEEYPEYGIFLDEKEKFLSASPWWDELSYRISEGNWKSQTKSRNQWGVHKHRADRKTIRKMSEFMDEFDDPEWEDECA